MKQIAVVCSPGVGDALILQIAGHHLMRAGYDVTMVTPHRFGLWLKEVKYGGLEGADMIFLQHDNTEKSQKIRASDKTVFTFYGSHLLMKHGPLRSGFDYVCDPNRTMVDNIVTALKVLFKIPATADNGFTPPPGLIHRKHKKRVAIHTTSGLTDRNWPIEKFTKVAKWLEKKGFEPTFLPIFPSLEELVSFIYESGYFLGNDSGPGHIASCMKVPHLIIGRNYRHMLFWRPGWLTGEVVVPPTWIPNWKGWRMREKHWKKFISTSNITNRFKNKVLCN